MRSRPNKIRGVPGDDAVPEVIADHAAPGHGIAVKIELDRVRVAEPGGGERHRVLDPEAKLVRDRQR